jgi:hypothetical protein
MLATILLRVKNGKMLAGQAASRVLPALGRSNRIPLDRDISYFRRLRPSSYIVNVSILAVAFLWNLVFLPVTVWKRYQDKQKVKAARQLLDTRCPRPIAPVS